MKSTVVFKTNSELSAGVTKQSCSLVQVCIDVLGCGWDLGII